MLHLTPSLQCLLGLYPPFCSLHVHTHTFLVDEDSGFDFMVLGLVYLHVSLFAPILAYYAPGFADSCAREKDLALHGP